MGFFEKLGFNNPKAKEVPLSRLGARTRAEKLAEDKEREDWATNKKGDRGDMSERGRSLPSRETPDGYSENEGWYQDEKRLEQSFDENDKNGVPNNEAVSNDDYYKQIAQPEDGVVEENIGDLKKVLDRELAGKLANTPDRLKKTRISLSGKREIGQTLAKTREMYSGTEEEALDAKIDLDLMKGRKEAFFRKVERNKTERANKESAQKSFDKIKRAAPEYSDSEIALMTKAFNWLRLSKKRRQESPLLDVKGGPLKPEEILELANDYGEYRVEQGEWGKARFKSENFRGREQLVNYKTLSDGQIEKYIAHSDDPGDYYYDLKEKSTVDSKNNDKMKYVFVKIIPGLLPRRLETRGNSSSNRQRTPDDRSKAGKRQTPETLAA